MAATLHASKGHPEAALEHQPQARARDMGSGCHLCRCRLSTITTLLGSHVIAGAAVAMSSLGSAVGIAMMVGGRGAPLLAAWLGPDWMRTPGWALSCSDEGCSHVGQAHSLP